MLAARKEWNQIIKREPKLDAVCAALPDLLCSVDKPFYHQHMKMICVFCILDCLAANCKKELDVCRKKKYSRRITSLDARHGESKITFIV